MSPAVLYGQAVVGPPGSGKTTFCDGMQQYLRLLGRNAWVVNLDPANEAIQAKNSSSSNTTKDDGDSTLPYDTLFDVCTEVVNLTSVMQTTGLGPNGGLVYCMEYLEAHVDEVVAKIYAKFANLSSTTINSSDDSKHNTNNNINAPPYLIFDLPGQVELYTHSTCVHRILHQMVHDWDLRLTAVQLVDAQYCTDATKFLSAALLGTTTMIRLELPTINVLSKVDLLTNSNNNFNSSDDLPMPLEFFTECHDLDRLLPFINHNNHNNNAPLQGDNYVDDVEYQKAVRRRKESRSNRKHAKLHAVFAEVVQDFGLLSFVPLDISDATSVGRVVAKIDQSNGYVFKSFGSSNNDDDDVTNSNNKIADMFQCAVQADSSYESIANIQERIVGSNGNGGLDTIPELER